MASLPSAPSRRPGCSPKPRRAQEPWAGGARGAWKPHCPETITLGWFCPCSGQVGEGRDPCMGLSGGMRSPRRLPKGCLSHRGGPVVLHGAAQELAAWQAVECPVLAWLSFTGTSLSSTNHLKPGALEGTLPAAGLAPGHSVSPQGEQGRRAGHLSPSHLVLPDVAQPLSCCRDPPAAHVPHPTHPPIPARAPRL